MEESDKLTKSMEEFLEQGQKTLNSVNKAINLYKYIFGGILLFLLGITLDTRVEVVRKADAEELNYIIKDIDRMFLTKKDATLIHSLEYQYYIRKSKDSTVSYPEQIKVILNSN